MHSLLKVLPVGAQMKSSVTHLCQRLMQDSSVRFMSRCISPGAKIAECKRRMQLALKTGTPFYVPPRRSEFKCLAYMESPCIEPKYTPIDTTMYKPNVKMINDYQRTWCDFKTSTPGRISDKVTSRKVYPTIARRDPKELRGKLYTACEPEDCKLPEGPLVKPPGLFQPAPSLWPKCKIRVPSCHSSMASRKCSAGRMPSCCVKPTAQHKSFSECKTFPIPKTICECSVKPSMCELWQYFRTKR